MSEIKRPEGPTAPDVSIVVPAWGPYAGAPLREALSSLSFQDLPARVIVVDNANEVLVEAPEADEVVRSPTRLTVGQARNLGLERVETPYVLFWDADDVMLPGTLRLVRSRIEANPRLVAVAAAILEGDPPVPHRWPRRWTRSLARLPRLFALCHSVWGLYPTTGSTIMRTAAVRESGGFGSAHSGDDWVLGVSLAFRGPVVLDPTPGRHYRLHKGSLWRHHSSQSHLRRHAAAVRARIREDPGIPGWARALLPMIWAGQLLALLALRPLVSQLRRASGPSRATATRF